MTTEGVTRPLRRRPRPRVLLGMRPRVLGWYALLLTLALAVTLVITFRQGEQAQ